MVGCHVRKVFGPHQVFDERILLLISLHDALHARIRQIILKLISHTILDITLMNNGMSIFQKLHV